MDNNAESTSLQDSGGVKKGEPTIKTDAPKVTSLNPKVLEAAQRTIAEAKARGFDIGIHSGLRTADEQNKLYAQGRTGPGEIVTNAKAYESWHCLGLAVDLVFKVTGLWTWNRPFAEWEQLGAIGKLSGFQEWGGDWIKLRDFPHFQIRGKLTIKEAKALLFEKNIEAVWALI